MPNIAFIFPGQASQYPGMGKDFFEKFPEARAVFDEADSTLGFPISKMCFEGPEESLKLTENTQPAMVAASVAALRALESKGITPNFVAGHSLGEYSALVAAGSLAFSDAVRLVRHRGQYMQEAVPPGAGAMAAILGLSHAQIEEVCRKAAAEGGVVSAANLNSPEQTVISGNADSVKRAVELASQHGAKRTVILPVSAPFHCQLMQPAQQKLEPELRAAPFAALRCHLVNNVDADEISTGDEARDGLIRQITAPVRWEDSVRELISLGVNMFVEVGPGKVLAGLLRQIERSVHCVSVEDSQSLQAALDKIAAARAESQDA